MMFAMRGVSGVLIVLALVVSACAHIGSSSPTMHEVTYLVTGSVARASITIRTPGGGTEQEDIDVPLKNEAGGDGFVYHFQSGDFAYIAAQKKIAYGTITCAIELDGVTVQTNTSDADYGIASCSGNV